MQYLKDSCPKARCIYLADTKNFPYGDKTSDQIVHAATTAVDLILSHWNPKTFVLACNTMSVSALSELRRIFPEISFIGTVPAIKLATAVTRNKRIGLLATNRTVQDPYTDNLIRKFASDCTVIRRGDAQLISFIEHDFFKASEDQRVDSVRPAVDFFLKNEVDTIILGCTHFVHVSGYIQKLAGKNIDVIDSRSGVVRQALKVAFSQNNQQTKPVVDEPHDRSFFVTSLSNNTEAKLYERICFEMDIPWGGVLGGA